MGGMECSSSLLDGYSFCSPQDFAKDSCPHSKWPMELSQRTFQRGAFGTLSERDGMIEVCESMDDMERVDIEKFFSFSHGHPVKLNVNQWNSLHT